MAQVAFRPVTLVLGICLALGALAHADDWAAELKDIEKDLSNGDPAVREAGVLKAAGLGTVEALNLVVTVFLKESAENVSAAAARAVGEIYVQQAARATPDPKFKSAWARAMGALNDGMLKHRDSFDVEGAILLSMTDAADPGFIKSLDGDLSKYKDDRINRARIYTLATIRDKAAIDGLMDMLYVAFGRGTRRFMTTIREAVRMATGEEFGNKDQAKKWWRDNRAKFEFPSDSGAAKSRVKAILGERDGSGAGDDGDEAGAGGGRGERGGRGGRGGGGDGGDGGDE